MPSLDSLGHGLDRLVDDYLGARSLDEAADLIRSHPQLLTPAAARAVLAMTDQSDLERSRRAHLLYRAELYGLARALRDLHDPTSRTTIGPSDEILQANAGVRAASNVDEAIERLRPVPRLADFADLDRDARRQVEHLLGDLLLLRYLTLPRREDLDDALVMVRRAFSAEPRIGTAEALGEAEFETYLLTGEQQRLIRAQDLIKGVLEQQDANAVRRPLTVAAYGRVQLAYYEQDADPDLLASALLSAELAADLVSDQRVAEDVIELVERVLEAATSAGERGVETSARNLRSAITGRLSSLPDE